MSLRIWIWGILAFPLTILNWLHRVYVYFLPFLGRGRALDTLWRDLGDAETFEEWEKAGLALDHHYNIDYWFVSRPASRLSGADGCGLVPGGGMTSPRTTPGSSSASGWAPSHWPWSRATYRPW